MPAHMCIQTQSHTQKEEEEERQKYFWRDILEIQSETSQGPGSLQGEEALVSSINPDIVPERITFLAILPQSSPIRKIGGNVGKI